MASRSTPVVAVYASTLCLPALSVALGRDHRHRHYHSSEAAVGAEEAAAASTPTVTDVDTVQLAIRATNNVSRMYARRILDAARLEREHPYYAAAPSSSSYSSASSFTEATIERTMTTKDEIVKGAFTTLVDIREKMNYIQSQLAASTTVAASSSSHRHGGNNVAYCESSSAKQKTLEDYNKLNLQTFGTLDQYTVIDADNNNNGNGDGSKPAEWSDHSIDLAKRRDEFGKQISPLTNVSAVERWYMACKRVVTLSCLAMPLATLVPLNIVLGKLVVSSSSTANGDGDAAGATTATTTTKASSTKNTALAPPPADVVGGIKKSGGIATRLHTRLTNKTWDYALWAIETAGPTYIKLVQWASTRHDLFSSEFVSHFSKLQDETRGHSWDETESTLVRAFGPNWRNIITFDIVIDDGEENNERVNRSSDSGGEGGGELQRRGGVANRARQGRLEQQSTKKNKLSKSTSSHPIGSGCVAQVYKARLTTSHGLHPPGTSVAVKVQHPRILEKVCLDFYIMNKVAAFLEYIPYLNLDYLSVKDSVDQFRDIMLPQLDLRVEGHNLQRFRRDFDGETQIAFPEPLLGLTSREVLVERFVEGEPMLNYVLCEDEKHSKKDREELATIGLETVMKMIFLHDFVHADLVSTTLLCVCVYDVSLMAS